jgi:hypothetical protein
MNALKVLWVMLHDGFGETLARNRTGIYHIHPSGEEPLALVVPTNEPQSKIVQGFNDTSLVVNVGLG